MKLSELLQAVLEAGDENVRIQNLLNDAHSIDKTKRGTKITFYTDGVQAEEIAFNGGSPNKTKNMGLVLWLPRDKVAAVLAAAKKAAPEMTYEQALKIVEGMTINDLKAIRGDDPRLPEINEACRVFLKDIERKAEGASV